MSFAEKILQRRETLRQDADRILLLQYGKALRNVSAEFIQNDSYTEVFGKNQLFVNGSVSSQDMTVSVNNNFTRPGTRPSTVIFECSITKKNQLSEKSNVPEKLQMTVSIEAFRNTLTDKKVLISVDSPEDAADKFSSIIANYVADNTQDPELSSTLKASDWW